MRPTDPNEPTGDGIDPTPPNYDLDPPKKDHTVAIAVGILLAIIVVILAT